ncbi:MAG TPA: hypothetical protein PKL49_09865 [Steroidobacteraceae bacterium]|nr:hypothetical protein [Steroidobacteraceae bacterium]HNS26659.1 hypothetical protein [Steroidobacteraceae bacterium]
MHQRRLAKVIGPLLVRLAVGAGALLLAGCGSVEIAPEPVIPRPLVRPIAATTAVVLGGEQRNFKHTETRAGVDWLVALGAGHKRLAEEVFGALFPGCVFVDELEEARGIAGLDAVFEPRMLQYSFATANETGAGYYAVTINYRINIYGPDLKLVDSYTLTGYGNDRDKALSSSEPLAGATRAAMRDAAAKFLVQFPQQPLAQRLASGEPLVAPGDAAPGEEINRADAARQIEAVPVLAPKNEPVSPPVDSQPKVVQLP